MSTPFWFLLALLILFPVFFPEDYKPLLDQHATEKAIKDAKDTFERSLSGALRLSRVTSPIFVPSGSGINDDLNGIENPVRFSVKNLDGKDMEIIQSLAKWKRMALADYKIAHGRGIYTDMNALRPDDDIDAIHSIYVDQWDWEKVITKDERNLDYLKETVRTIYSAIKRTSFLLSEDFPEIRAIASLYLGSGAAYEQEYEVAEDGMVETPRVISGYILDDYMRLSAMSELNFHFVSSHFQHPDDVLDEDRGASLGWAEMYRRLCEYVEWVEDSAPAIRYLTGSEMAGAVQRFYYVDVERELTEEGLTLTLSNFQDEAWFLARFNDWEPDTEEGAVSGGTIEHLQGNLYLIKAEEAEVMVKKKVEA